MIDALLMQIIKSLDDLRENLGTFFFKQSSCRPLSNHLLQALPHNILHDQVQLSGSINSIIKGHNIIMLYFIENFNFPDA